MDVSERMPGDAEAAGAIEAMAEAHGWSVGDRLTYRRPGADLTAARVATVLSSGWLLVHVDSPKPGESRAEVVLPGWITGIEVIA